MPLHRRDFMKVLGISVASLYLTRCGSPFVTATCYTQVPEVTITPPPTTPGAARERLRRYWLRFDELAFDVREDPESNLAEELTNGHRLELDDLVASGGISPPIADLVQEAYQAAVVHVAASNSGVTCYEMPLVNYVPDSADVLVEQAEVLNQIAEEGTIDPETLAKAQTALEHDLSFYALTNAEVDALYDQVYKDIEGTEQFPPPFEDLPLEPTPEVKEATQFIIDLLTGK